MRRPLPQWGEENDEQLLKDQSMQLYNALKARKIPTRLAYYKREGHDFDSPVVTGNAMNEILTWMKAHRGKEKSVDGKKLKQLFSRIFLIFKHELPPKGKMISESLLDSN